MCVSDRENRNCTNGQLEWDDTEWKGLIEYWHYIVRKMMFWWTGRGNDKSNWNDDRINYCIITHPDWESRTMTMAFGGCLFFSLLLSTSNAANILIYSPTLSYSHVAFNGKLADLLVTAGHRVVSILLFPIESIPQPTVYLVTLRCYYWSKSIHMCRRMVVRMRTCIESVSTCNRIV